MVDIFLGEYYIFMPSEALLKMTKYISSAISSTVFPSMSHIYIGLFAIETDCAEVSCRRCRFVMYSRETEASHERSRVLIRSIQFWGEERR